MPAKPPGPLTRSNYLSWPPGPYDAAADPNNAGFNPAAVLPAAGIVSYGDAALDLEQYHRPLERLHSSGLHGAGVASGLQIKCTVGLVNLVVAPGLALDAAGRHIYLAVGGTAEIGPTANVPGTPSNLVPVAAAGATFPTAGLTGDKYVVVQWRETWDAAAYASDPNITQYVDTPWLQMIAAASYLPDLHVVLGKVSLDATGKVTAASYGDPGGLQRTGASLPAQSLELRRAVNTATPGADTAAWGSVRAREGGGIEIAVAKAADQMSMLTTAGGTFATLAVGANNANFGNIASPGIFLKGFEATIEVGAPGNYGDVLVHDGHGHLAVSLIGDTGHIVVGGPTLNGKVRVMNANATDTMNLDGATGSAVVQRLKAFSAQTHSIDVDATYFKIHGTDLMLDGRSGKNNRALVDGTNQLIVNFAGDYARGVEVHGPGLKVDGVLTDGANVPLMGNPARKVMYAPLYANKDAPARVTFDVDLQFARQFSASCALVMVNSTSNFDYDNAVFAEVYAVDGVQVSDWVYGGSGKFGNNQGDDANLHVPFTSGVGRIITFRAGHLGPDCEVAALGIVYFE